MVYTADLTSNYLASLPKVWTQHDKSASIYDPGNLAREWASGNIIAAQGQGLLNMAIMIGASQAAGALTGGAGGFLSGAASMAAGVGAGLFTSMWLDQQIAGCGGSAVQSSEIINTIDTAIVGSGKNLRMVSNNNWFTVDQGPIYELAPGYTPDLKFCQNRIIGIEHCAHKYVVRDMINKYHNEHRNNHVRYVTEIEPRGKDGCYYKMKQVEYDPETNLEGTIETDTEVVLQHEIADYATCTYKSTTFASSINDVNYPIRSYPEPAPNGFGSSTGRILYPTRDTVYTSDLMARYVRIRPPISGGLLNIAHFAVFDISGLNMSVMQPTYGTSKATGAGSSDTPVSGTIDSSGSTLDSVWQPATQGSSEYWEVDLGLNILIAEVVYVSGTIPGSATTGVRIQFLYTNDPNESPIHEVALPNDKPIQYIPVYSSSYTVPSYPLGGPIKIPRPLPTKGKLLGIENGCVNTCESRKTIDNLIEQYNKMTTGSQILKVINGTTATTSKCEYLTEMVVSDTTAGSDTVGKSSIVKQYVSMQLSPPVITKVSGNVFARFVRVIPSFVPGTVLEISKLLVWNTLPDISRAVGAKKAGYNVAKGKQNGNVSYYNEYYELNEYDPKPPDVVVTDGGSTAFPYPFIFKARDNSRNTYFQVDLTPDDSRSCMGTNFEIFQIMIVGRADRTLGGLKGVTIQLFADVPEDQEHCCDGTYDPVYSYTLPTDDSTQMITVRPPSQCSFNLLSTTNLLKPLFLQDNTSPLSEADTSGGVFGYSSIMGSLKSTWDSLLPATSTDLSVPLQANVEQSNTIVKGMLETVSAAQTIAGTTKKCSDTDVLSMMMTAYNIARGPKHTDEYGVTKYTMNRILKAGQATPNTCDVLFEQVYELYDDYITDITDASKKGTEIKGVRFTMSGPGAVPALDAPRARQKNIVDVSANALGILSDASALAKPFSGPTFAANCRDVNLLNNIKGQLESTPRRSGRQVVSSSIVGIVNSFQTTPLSCEYTITKTTATSVEGINYTSQQTDIESFVKALFSLGSDGKTLNMVSVTEYDPQNITFNSSYSKSYMNGREVSLPSIFSYDPNKDVSTRVNTTPYTYPT